MDQKPFLNVNHYSCMSLFLKYLYLVSIVGLPKKKEEAVLKESNHLICNEHFKRRAQLFHVDSPP